ncbi:alanine racemase [Microbacterium hominis]|uniref:Alanine racemase n=1 Tax=Microbacterium hominis TaxID=162426 RepID=A0A7D4U4J7_9MICO|nr:alanine racemase [Microbacterium hominis]QKJ19445.1 alanine racemase [Microbacterium hominis]
MSAVLTVDLDVFAANLDRVRAAVAPARLMLVVKDDAYGHGLPAIVGRAVREGIDWFGAFDVTTALAVRETAGPRARVFSWMAASEEDIARAVGADIDLGIGDEALLEDAAAVAHRTGRTLSVHLKIDTGLHRNGVRPERWPAFVARAAALESAGALRVQGIWSHIAEASDADDDAARSAFETALAQAAEAGLRPAVRHLAASAASFARPEFRYDMVRVGAFTYGIRPAGGPSSAELGIHPIAALRTRVHAVEGAHAVLEAGMGDGIPSLLGGRVEVATPAGPRRIREVAVRTIVDAWPGAAVGDEVVVFGARSHGAAEATDLAEAIGTIGEEIALRVSPRVPREYRGR